MSTVEITIDLPFFLRLEGPFIMEYDQVCQESKLSDLAGHDFQITFSRKPAGTIDYSTWPPKERSTVAIRTETGTPISNESVNIFAIRNCLEILNRVILSYLSTTGEVSNAGFITTLGTSYMQLFAEIKVDGVEFRDRWPSHNINTFPLQPDQIQKFKGFLVGEEGWPVTLFHTNAILSLEQGQYSLAVIQAATAVELRMTQYVVARLVAACWSAKKIKDYEEKTLGQKLGFDQTDLRSLEKHFGAVTNFSTMYICLKNWFKPLRNKVIHRGYLASHEEAIEAVKVAREFLKMVP